MINSSRINWVRPNVERRSKRRGNGAPGGHETTGSAARVCPPQSRVFQAFPGRNEMCLAAPTANKDGRRSSRWPLKLPERNRLEPWRPRADRAASGRPVNRESACWRVAAPVQPGSLGNTRTGLRQVVSKGKHRKPSEGGYTGGSVPYGYRRKDDGTIAVVPEEAAVVERIFSLVAEGRNLPAIAKALREENAPKRNGVVCDRPHSGECRGTTSTRADSSSTATSSPHPTSPSSPLNRFRNTTAKLQTDS